MISTPQSISKPSSAKAKTMVTVVYDSKYGNTKKVAEAIVQGLSQVEGTYVVFANVKAVSFEKVAASDLVILGSPNHLGKPSRCIEEFIDKLGKVNLKTGWAAVFDTHLASDIRAHERMEKKLQEKVSALRLITPGLSVRVTGFLKGPIVEGELTRCENFGKTTAAQLKHP